MLKAPFPWFGGKSRVAPLVWQAFGDVPNYVEPFAGSLAVLLGRPHTPKIETVNDADCYLANFWRALAADPDELAAFANWPVNEADLHARHYWLIQQHGFRERMKADPEYFDMRVAGWWVWGICQWIGTGWCQVRELRDDGTPSEKLPHLGDAGRGVHRPSQQLPHLGTAGMGLHEYLRALAERMRRVRVACGDWSRVMGDSVTWRHGITGVFLDPPYGDDQHAVEYGGGNGVAGDVAAWAFANGGNAKLRIVLCGYEGEHEAPKGWRVVPWKTRGGYGSQSDGRGRENARKERLWLSPHCVGESDLFSMDGAA
jgi:DNA adenine methylase